LLLTFEERFNEIGGNMYSHSEKCLRVMTYAWLAGGLFGRLYADPLDNWTTNNISRFYANAMVYGNGMYVAAGADCFSCDTGSIYTSPDGTNWTPRFYSTTNNTTLQLYGIAYGQGTFVAVGYTGSIYSSTNGIDWVFHQNPVPMWNLFGVTYGNGTFVAVGGPQTYIGTNTVSNILTSVDGVNWTPHRIGLTSSPSFYSVAYGNGYFFAVGDGGSVRYSTTGNSWSSSGAPNNLTFSSVAYGNGKFVASFGSNTNLIIDTQSPFFPASSVFQPSGTTANIVQAAYANGVFLGSGYSASLNTNVFLTSRDGTNWSQRNTYFNGTVGGITSDGHRFVAVAGNPSTGIEDYIPISTAFVSDPINNLNVQFTGSGSPQLQLSGLVGPSYEVQYLNAFSVTGTDNWQTLTNLILPASPFTWSDTQASNSPSRFYRAVLLSP